MYYILNGGRDEFGILKSENYTKYLKNADITQLLIIPLAIRELKDPNFRDKFLERSNFQLSNKYKTKILEYTDSEEETDEKLKNTDAIYFTGGVPYILLKRLKKRNLDKKIKILAEAEQVKIISGGSAGEMILGEKTIIGHIEIKRIVDGLDFLHGFIIDSHFTNRNRLKRLTELLKKLDYKYKGIGVDENTSVVLDEKYNILDIFGDGSVTCITGTDIKVYDKK